MIENDPFRCFVPYPEAPVKLEGMALAGDGRLMLINDDDFGIDGATTKILLIDGTGIRMN